MSQGVEWALHTCLNLSWMESGESVAVGRLAAFYGLSVTYLNKHLQALTRAGILASISGPRGGFQLARAPESISLLDIVVAIEGAEEAFRCDQILRHGPGADPEADYRQSCLMSQAMRRADLAWRRELAAQTLADVKASVERQYPASPRTTRARLAALRT